MMELMSKYHAPCDAEDKTSAASHCMEPRNRDLKLSQQQENNKYYFYYYINKYLELENPQT